MSVPKKLRPSMETVHKKILSCASDKVAAVDAIKLYGVDGFFCEYAKYLADNGEPMSWYILAAQLYHGSKQHWRRVPG